MIDICMSGMCENCKYAELELESLFINGFKEDQRTEYTLKCRHEEICYLWERKLESERAKFKYKQGVVPICGLSGEDVTIMGIETLKRLGRYDLLPPCERRMIIFESN